MFYHRTTYATVGAVTSEAREFTHVFSEVCVARFLIFCVVIYRPLFVVFVLFFLPLYRRTLLELGLMIIHLVFLIIS